MLKKLSLLCAAAMMAISAQAVLAADDADVPPDVVQYDSQEDGGNPWAGHPCFNAPGRQGCPNWYGPGMRWRGGRGHGPQIPPGMRTPPPAPGGQMGGPGPMGFMGHPGWGPGGPGPRGEQFGPGGWHAWHDRRGMDRGGAGYEAMGLPGIGQGQVLEQLNLTDAQKSQMVDLLTNNFRNRLQNRMEMQDLRSKLRELQKSDNPDSGMLINLNQSLGAARGKMEVMKNQLKSDLKNILTEEQQKKLEEAKDQWKSRWGGGDRGFSRGQKAPKGLRQLQRGPGPVVNPGK